MQVSHILHVESFQKQGSEDPPTKYGNLWLGGVGAFKTNAMENIGAVLTIMDQPTMKWKNIPELIQHLQIKEHKWFNLEDQNQEPIIQIFDDAHKFIDKNIDKTNVLVHCQMGISRSASVVISYIMRKYGRNFKQTLKYVKQKRSWVDPNDGFTKQLIIFEENLIKQGKEKQIEDKKQKQQKEQIEK